MATALAECARIPSQVAEWSDWSTYESTGRRALRPRRRNRIAMFGVVPVAWFLGIFHALGPTP